MRVRFRYSISTFLVILTLLCVWLGKVSIEARRQKNAVEWVKQHGGGVAYDWNEHHKEYWKPAPPHPYPKWLRDIFGEDCFQTVTYVWVNSNDLSTLADLPATHTLILSDNDISDLTPLMALQKLKVLDVNRNQVVDLSPLAHLPLLSRLHAEDNCITDLAPLLTLNHLMQVELKGNPVSAVQLQKLNKLMEERAFQRRLEELKGSR